MAMAGCDQVEKVMVLCILSAATIATSS